MCIVQKMMLLVTMVCFLSTMALKTDYRGESFDVDDFDFEVDDFSTSDEHDNYLDIDSDTVDDLDIDDLDFKVYNSFDTPSSSDDTDSELYYLDFDIESIGDSDSLETSEYVWKNPEETDLDLKSLEFDAVTTHWKTSKKLRG